MILLPFDKFICREGMSVNIILNIYHNYSENEYARRILFLIINYYYYYIYFDYIDSTVHLNILFFTKLNFWLVIKNYII